MVGASDYYTDAILSVARHAGRPFDFLTDEWDAPIRERSEELPHRYVDFLRALFKNASVTAEAVAVAYMTETLPIKRYNTESGRLTSYWTRSAAHDSLLTYIERDFDGLQDKVADLVSGERVSIKPCKYDNDIREVNDSDDVFTVLAHLGYVAFDEDSDTVHVPNEEVHLEFVSALARGSHPEVRRLVQAADKTLKATLDGDAEAVSASVQATHLARGACLAQRRAVAVLCRQARMPHGNR